MKDAWAGKNNRPKHHLSHCVDKVYQQSAQTTNACLEEQGFPRLKKHCQEVLPN